MRHRRVVVTHYGGSDALQVVEEECPEPRSGEVRVKVLAADVSRGSRCTVPALREGHRLLATWAASRSTTGLGTS